MAQFFGVLVDGDGVQVRDEVERIVFILQCDELPDGTQVVSEMVGVAGGLQARDNALFTFRLRNGFARHACQSIRPVAGSVHCPTSTGLQTALLLHP